ncbi:lysine N(6)-hydroxylase/L-ornithine N(5)-oxygenase family protein [Catenulispora sp. GP43]|uniref:lysine N(6)-hydroxylase/L-ornithine N(5)-oxygenase family protein n=1 Tax=Catenulispora sp. GP43 TaxID=3156263 RepID=UPI0035178B30
MIGIGFGPANLALAVALAETQTPTGTGTGAETAQGAPAPARTLPGRTLFFERKPRFGWHQDMLIEGATMQVAFLKDLATMRNPTSTFTYISYLHSRHRLADFINSKSFYPYRVEYHDYLEWAAQRLDHLVRYDSEVVAVRARYEDGIADLLEVDVRTQGRTRTHLTRNVVIGAGLVPKLPKDAAVSGRIWHSAELLSRLKDVPADRGTSFAVVGAGQSAAEVVAHLHQTYQGADVHAVFSRFGYSVADDSPLANRIFDPVAVDQFYQAPENVREMLLDYHRDTNYSVVDLDLTQELHDITYREGLSGRRRLHLHNVSRLRGVTESPDGVDLVVEFLPSGEVETIRVDALVYATGYEPADPLALLGDLGAQCKRDDQGRLVLGRDYQVITSDSLQCGLYLHGAGAEHTHGLTAGLLSTVATRAGEITRSILDHVR